MEDWSDEDELSLEKLAKKSASTNSPSQDALPSERDTSSTIGGKEANFDVMLVYEVDQWVAEGKRKFSFLEIQTWKKVLKMKDRDFPSSQE